ncbi:MAG: methionyl aminopeptidase [Verrucomicrobia bacterium]|nr:methionyl aminopeptidase [Verrucomicrobiota bacterium]
MGRNDNCWCGSGKKFKKCHAPNLSPGLEAERLRDQYARQYQIHLKTDEEIQGIRAACQLAAQILKRLVEEAKEGLTTNALDQLARQLHQEAGAIPAPLNYGSPPYPKSICTSLNEVICHGFPDDTPLKKGDILNIDVSPMLNGFYGDCSAMACIGEISQEKALVVDVSKECLYRALAICRPGVLVQEIGDVIEAYAREKGCSVVHQFVGHGVGIEFHELPQIPHCYNDIKIPLAPGMIFTIEPMINAGKPEAVFDANQWTARTIDGKASAQWEHTVLITATGHEILTIA